MNILSQREISGFLPEKHVEEILSRRELINGCSIDKPYVQDGQVFTLKLENGLFMTISKDLINSLREVIRHKQNYPVFDSSYTGMFLLIERNCCDSPMALLGCAHYMGERYPEINGARLVSMLESNDKNSFILLLEGQDEPITVSKPKLCNQVRSLSLFRWRTLTLLNI